uniref:Putative holin n=1 Tax=Edwardsiella phage eiDWF TaxID=945084 RepID=E7EKY3_9VIRU|nr:putative holin [Edwardsiella phage eiDWF]
MGHLQPKSARRRNRAYSVHGGCRDQSRRPAALSDRRTTRTANYHIAGVQRVHDGAGAYPGCILEARLRKVGGHREQGQGQGAQ